MQFWVGRSGISLPLDKVPKDSFQPLRVPGKKLAPVCSPALAIPPWDVICQTSQPLQGGQGQVASKRDLEQGVMREILWVALFLLSRDRIRWGMLSFWMRLKANVLDV